MAEQRNDMGRYFDSVVVALQQMRDLHDSYFSISNGWRLLDVDFQHFDHETWTLSFDVLSDFRRDEDCVVQVRLVEPGIETGMISTRCLSRRCEKNRRGCIHTFAVVQRLLNRLKQPNDEVRMLIQSGGTSKPRF